MSTLSTTDHPRTHDLYIFRTDGNVLCGVCYVAGKSANLILSHSLLLLHIYTALNTLNYCYRNKYECVLSAHTLRHANKKLNKYNMRLPRPCRRRLCFFQYTASPLYRTIKKSANSQFFFYILKIVANN